MIEKRPYKDSVPFSFMPWQLLLSIHEELSLIRALRNVGYGQTLGRPVNQGEREGRGKCELSNELETAWNSTKKSV